MRILSRAIAPVIALSMGWYAGAKYGAPEMLAASGDAVTTRVASLFNRAPNDDKATSDNQPDNVSSVVEVKTPSPVARPADPIPDDITDIPKSATERANAIELCKMVVSNAPVIDGDFHTQVSVGGTALLRAPVTNACLSSGYGYRGYAPHNGIDYYSNTGGMVLAAGPGTISEANYRDDYGNMIVIDHGNGVYTRYAHLAQFTSAAKVGARVLSGQELGPIGQTGRATAPHLHFEIRTGDYDNPKRSFGLDPVNPYKLPVVE